MMEESKKSTVLVTGATGYVGGRLVTELLQHDYPVRVMSRRAGSLTGRDWSDKVEVFEGDVLKPETLDEVMQGVDVAYYLIHSMGSDGDFMERDARAARNFGNAAQAAGVQRIIYLGGLGDDSSDLSHHLESRHKVGEVLRESGVAVTEFRAAVIVGSGSISFEMIRYLTERVPAMICPQWVYTRIQPIAIRDVLNYLVTALEVPQSKGEIIEIGGTDVQTYGSMMMGYAEARGLKRWLVPVPVLTPRLSSYWVHLVTPIPASIAQPLIDGLRNEVIVNNPKAHQLFPDITPMSYHDAVHRALDKLEAREVETTWTDSLGSSMGDTQPYTFEEREGMMIEQRLRKIDAPPHDVYQAFTRLGGQQGWLYLNWAWQLRGRMDRLAGGPGYRRGRRNPYLLRIGDVIDFWRVEAIEPDQMVRLRAEMKMPGRGWLQFEVEPLENGQSQLTQTAFFAPKGLPGFAYWYMLFIVHKFIFDGMIDRLKLQAENLDNPQEAEKPIVGRFKLLAGGLFATIVVSIGLVKIFSRD